MLFLVILVVSTDSYVMMFAMSCCVCVVLICVMCVVVSLFFFFQAEDGIRDLVRSRGLGDVYKRQDVIFPFAAIAPIFIRDLPCFVICLRTFAEAAQLLLSLIHI